MRQWHPTETREQRERVRDEQASARLRTIADGAKQLKAAGLDAPQVLALLRESFPDLASALKELPDEARPEITKTFNAVTKAERDHECDLDSEDGRVALITKTAQRLGYAESGAQAFTEFVDDHPDLYAWVQCAPSARARPRPEVHKSEPRTVRTIMEEKFEQLAKREQREGETYETAFARLLTGTRGRELYDVYSHPRAHDDPVTFVKFVQRWDPEFAKTATRIIYGN
jgi:hypothetical protein